MIVEWVGVEPGRCGWSQIEIGAYRTPGLRFWMPSQRHRPLTGS